MIIDYYEVREWYLQCLNGIKYSKIKIHCTAFMIWYEERQPKEACWHSHCLISTCLELEHVPSCRQSAERAGFIGLHGIIISHFGFHPYFYILFKKCAYCSTRLTTISTCVKEGERYLKFILKEIHVIKKSMLIIWAQYSTIPTTISTYFLKKI